MKQQDVFRKIGGILQEITEQYDYIKQNIDEPDEVELELFAANAQFLKDHTEILRKLNSQRIVQKPVAEKLHEPILKPVKDTVPPYFNPVPQKPDAANEEKFFEPVVQQLKGSNNNAPAVDDEGNFDDEQEDANQLKADTITESENSLPEKDEPETIRHELIIDEDEMWDDEDEELYDEGDIVEVESDDDIEIADDKDNNDVIIKPEVQEVEAAYEEEEVHEPEPVAQIQPEYTQAKPVVVEQTVTVEDKIDPVVTINQKIAIQAEKKEQAPQPIADLKTAINLNDKLQYINQLFNGYSLAYSEAIEILNRFNSFDEAERFLKANYIDKNNWEGKPVIMKKFFDLLKRRYAQA